MIKTNLFIIVIVLALSMICFYADAQAEDKVTIIDSRHYSNVFGEMRNYRIFLPPGYYSKGKKYPAIYFLHGYAQRYFGDGGNGYAGFDKGGENNGDNIENFVSTHDVIVVKADGYNRSPDENNYPRPYNIGPVETYRQFPLYFPELIEYIDTHYNTISSREHRAISGLSMGGFMSLWIGGKYPDLFSAVGDFCGSAEFIVGPKDFPVEYRHIDMYKNYSGMNIRLNYGDKDFIRGYHQDMNRIWPQLMDSYESKMYDAEHSTCGLGEMFDFFMKTFKSPPARPQKVDHIDVYPEFSVWGYHVSSDRNVPGFTILENADKKGLRCSVKEFVPDGELIPAVNLSVITPPIYEKNKLYVINDCDTRTLRHTKKTVCSDNEGRIKIFFNGSRHEIGINKTIDKPNVCIAAIEMVNAGWVTHNKNVTISIRLLNKGLDTGKRIKAILSATGKSVVVKQSKSEFGAIGVNKMKQGLTHFSFYVQDDSVDTEKFKLTIRDENKNEWVEFFNMPVKKDSPEIKDFAIADGKIFTVSKGGTDSETLMLGSGNGDGVANPGESIVVLVKDNDKYWRTQLSFSDKYVNPFGVNSRMSDNWTSFDHVGASAKYSVPLISSDCPENHSIDFFAEYWIPEYPLHIIKRGLIKINITGKDQTPPAISWVKVPGNNILLAKINDGSKIQYVRAKLIKEDDPAKSFDVELTDDGLGGDSVQADNVFSKKIPEQKYGVYKVILEAMDASGNKIRQNMPGNFVLY